MVKKEKREPAPSRKDVYGWKRIWCPTNFGGTETEPRKVLADFIVKIWKEEFWLATNSTGRNPLLNHGKSHYLKTY